MVLILVKQNLTVFRALIIILERSRFLFYNCVYIIIKLKLREGVISFLYAYFFTVTWLVNIFFLFRVFSRAVSLGGGLNCLYGSRCSLEPGMEFSPPAWSTSLAWCCSYAQVTLWYVIQGRCFPSLFSSLPGLRKVHGPVFSCEEHFIPDAK